MPFFLPHWDLEVAFPLWFCELIATCDPAHALHSSVLSSAGSAMEERDVDHIACSLSFDDGGRGEVFLIEHHLNIRSIVILIPRKLCSHTSGEGYCKNECTLWFTFSHSISQ